MPADLFDPFKLGPVELANRLVMAPMTRNRAGEAGVPTALNAQYYAQRATAGLIVTEGTRPSAMGQGYPNTPGVHTDAQVAGWREVTDAVHAAGGRIAVQLMHAGRISHPVLLPSGAAPVAPSAVRPAGQAVTGSGMEDFTTPRALATEELPSIVAEFADAARRAIAAGFDLVELHGANGYLLHQFLAENTNQRTDGYGASAEGRARFVVEVTTAVARTIGGERTGLRISPAGHVNDIAEVDSLGTYTALVDALNPLGLAYLHVVEGPATHVHDALHPRWTGPFMLNTGFTGPSDKPTAQAILSEDRADLVSFGRPFLANPDLVERLRRDAPLNEPDQPTFYGGGAEGYTDYPALADA